MDLFGKVITDIQSTLNENHMCFEYLFMTEGRSVIEESVFDIDIDVDYLYNNFYSKLIDFYKNNIELSVRYSEHDGRIMFETDSSVLNSDIGKEAHTKNPIRIEFGFFKTSHYDPEAKLVRMALNTGAINALGNLGLDNEQVIQNYPQIVNEFSKNAKEAVLAHELTHWIEDSIFNNKAKRFISKYNDTVNNSDWESREENNNIFKIGSEMELQAQVASLNRLKVNIGEEKYNKLTLKELAHILPSFGRIIASFNYDDGTFSNSNRVKIMNNFIKRLHREGLLGKSMVSNNRLT